MTTAWLEVLQTAQREEDQRDGGKERTRERERESEGRTDDMERERKRARRKEKRIRERIEMRERYGGRKVRTIRRQKRRGRKGNKYRDGRGAATFSRVLRQTSILQPLSCGPLLAV